MNILFLVIFSCAINHVVASKRKAPSSERQEGRLVPATKAPRLDVRVKAQEFSRMLQSDNWLMAGNIWEDADEGLKMGCAKCMISLKEDGLVRLAKRDPHIMSLVLKVIMSFADKPFTDRLFNRLNPHDSFLATNVAADVTVASKPDRFIYLLKRITDKACQGQAAQEGIAALFRYHATDRILPLIFELERGASQDQTLRNVVLEKIFISASRHVDDRIYWIKRLYYSPVITVETYSEALLHLYDLISFRRDCFFILLKNANRSDLEMVKKSDSYMRSPELQSLVHGALETIDTRATRSALGQVMVGAIKEFIKKCLQPHIASVLHSIVLDYIHPLELPY